MKECKLTVDIYGHWGGVPPRYRIYVNNELLTERDFIYPGHEKYVTEHILVNLKPGDHVLKIEKIGDQGAINYKNITLNNAPSLAEFRVLE